jgi:hypothetical protein
MICKQEVRNSIPGARVPVKADDRGRVRSSTGRAPRRRRSALPQVIGDHGQRLPKLVARVGFPLLLHTRAP